MTTERIEGTDDVQFTEKMKKEMKIFIIQQNRGQLFCMVKDS